MYGKASIVRFWGNTAVLKSCPKQLTKVPPRICNQRVEETNLQIQIWPVSLGDSLRYCLHQQPLFPWIFASHPSKLSVSSPASPELSQVHPCPFMSLGHTPSLQHLFSTPASFQYTHFLLPYKTLICGCQYLHFLVFVCLCQFTAASTERTQRKFPFVSIYKKMEWNLYWLLLQSLSEVIYATYQLRVLISNCHFYSYVYDGQLQIQTANFSICAKKYACNLFDKFAKCWKLSYGDSFHLVVARMSL